MTLDRNTVLSVLDNLRRSGAKTNLSYHAWVSLSKKFICMTVPKVSCTRIKTTLFTLEGNTPPERIGHIHNKGLHLTDVDPELAWDILSSRDWFKFAFVRNPYDRLFSAYKSKVGNNSDIQYEGVRAEIRARNFYPSDHCGKTPLVSFADFVHYVQQIPDPRRDGHWQSQTAILQCDWISYDFVGRFENFRDDFQEVLARIGAPMHLRDTSLEVLNPTTKVPLSYVYDSVLAETVYDLYEEDFRNFHYDKDSWRYFY